MIAHLVTNANVMFDLTMCLGIINSHLDQLITMNMSATIDPHCSLSHCFSCQSCNENNSTHYSTKGSMGRLDVSNHYEDCGTHHLSCHISLKATCHKQVKAGPIPGFLEAICFIKVAWCWNNIILRLPRSFGCGLSMVSLEICLCKNVENTGMLM